MIYGRSSCLHVAAGVVMIMALTSAVSAPKPASAKAKTQSKQVSTTGPKSGAESDTLIIARHPTIDSAIVRKLYLDGDFDQAIEILDKHLLDKRQYRHEDSVFIFKHLGVMYAAKYETREKGKYYMHQLLMVEPTAKIMDMYASDMIYMIFKNIQDEFDSNRMRLGRAENHVSENLRTEQNPNTGATTAKLSEPSGSKTWVWVGATTAVVALGVGHILFLLMSPKRSKKMPASKAGGKVKMNRMGMLVVNPLLWVGAFCLFLVSACELSKQDKVETTISFNRIFDSLSRYESVTIALKAPDGHTIDVVFKGKVEKPADIEKLAAPHWDGGIVIVDITGFSSGKIVYHSETSFNGADNRRDSTIVFQDPDAALTSVVTEIVLVQGDSSRLPKIGVVPATLADKTLNWTSSEAGVLVLGPDFMKAASVGSTQLTASLKSDAMVSLKIKVTVLQGGMVPETLTATPESLGLTANGASANFRVQVFPSAAVGTVEWTSQDSTIAVVSPNGTARGFKEGVARIVVRSGLRASVQDTVYAVVKPEVRAQAIAFSKETTEIYIGGAAESLLVLITPPEADPSVTFTVVEPTLAAIVNNSVSGVAEGVAHVIAKSISNPALTDTLTVKVSSRQLIDSVRIATKSFTIFTGGESRQLTAAVHPALASQKVLWRSGSPRIAQVDSTGNVKALAPGRATIYAISLVDSLRKDSSLATVKRDVPQLSVGSDTVVSIGQTVDFTPVVAPQEYGVITAFRWDLDGNGAWDDSDSVAKTVSFTYESEKETLVRFYVRDSEGNEVVVTKKVSAVSGLVVLIRSPVNNSYSQKSAIAVVWTIDGKVQDTGVTANLKDGANIITRTAFDRAGKAFRSSVTVYLDSIPPGLPQVSGNSPTSVMPRWIWSSGGGAGFFRYRLGDGTFPVGAPESRDTTYSLLTAANGSTYTLFVQERDAAGNWSGSASLPIKYDITKPTVAINPPHTPGSTFITSLDTFGLAGTCGGLNAISKVVYTLDGGTAINALLGAAGEWSIPGIKFANAKTTVIKITATDILGNTGEATLSVLCDKDLPLAPSGLSSPLSPTNSTSVTWTWSPGSDGVNGSGLNGNYRWKLNSGAWTETKNTTAANVGLADGVNAFSVQEQDKALNWSVSATNSVTLDNKAPDAVAFTGTDKAYTTNRQPTWTWTPSASNGGIASYAATLEAPNGTTNFDLTTTTWKPTSNQADGAYKLTIRQRDQVAGVLGAAASFTLNIDGTAPVISVTGKASGSTTALNSSNSATLTGSITDAGGSGIASATWELSGGTTKAAAGISSPASFSIPTGTMANHATTTLTLKARDGAGNTITTYTVNFAVEVAAPTVQWLPGTTDDGYITSHDQVPVRYSINGGTAIIESFELTDAAQPDIYTTNTKTITATNAIGETVSDTRTFFRVYKDVRFYSPNGGYGDCQSWKDACRFDATNVSGDTNLILWLASGTYEISTSFSLPAGATFKGQLKTTSKTSTDRSASASILSSTGATLAINNTRLEYLTFTATNLGISGYLQIGVVDDRPTSVIIDHCIFDGITGSSVEGAAMNGRLNNGNRSMTRPCLSAVV